MNARLERALRGIFTERRITLYPLLTFGVLVSVAAFDRLFGDGLENAFGGGVGGDFLAFYTGGHFVANGAAEKLYDADAQLAFQSRVVGAELDGVARWVSPPYVAWLFAPLGLMPYLWALTAWTLVSLAGVWLGFRVLGRELALRQSPSRLLFVALQYYPALQWVLNGQATGLWLVLLVNTFVLLRRGKDVAAGAVLGCFALKPPLALGVAVALLAAGRFRALAAAALSASAFVALGFVTLEDAMLEYLQRGSELVDLVRSEGYATAGLHGSFELATLLLDGISPKLAVLAGTLLMLAVLGWLFVSWLRVPWSPATPAWDVRMAATLAAGVIASPHLFIYDLALLLLPLCVLLARSTPGHPPLDGWPRLPLVASIWALGLLGPALTLLQQIVSRRLFGFPMALQLGALVIVWTGVVLMREADALTDR